MLTTNAPSDVLGIRFKRDSDDAAFMRFFEIVQRAAERHGRVFFLDAAEGNDLITDEIDCSDLSGWLVKPEDISEFETFWRNDEESMPDKFTIDMVIAHWSWVENDISIDFEFYNSWMVSTPARGGVSHGLDGGRDE